MQSTRNGPPPPYLGIDLTDRYSKSCRPIDVCGLTPEDDGYLSAEFWAWKWDPAGEPIDVGPLLPEVAHAMLDGPQGLATPRETMRSCERAVGAAGKTPYKLTEESAALPFAGFVRSSLELFEALDKAGVELASTGTAAGRVGEVYPGDLWPLLPRPGFTQRNTLPKKTSGRGWLIRKALLEAASVRFSPTPPAECVRQPNVCLRSCPDSVDS